MHHFLWGKLVLVLVAIVAILQVIHLVLLSRLEARHHQQLHQFHSGNNNLPPNSKTQDGDNVSELQSSEVILFINFNSLHYFIYKYSAVQLT